MEPWKCKGEVQAVQNMLVTLWQLHTDLEAVSMDLKLSSDKEVELFAYSVPLKQPL